MSSKVINKLFKTSIIESSNILLLPSIIFPVLFSFAMFPTQRWVLLCHWDPEIQWEIRSKSSEPQWSLFGVTLRCLPGSPCLGYGEETYSTETILFWPVTVKAHIKNTSINPNFIDCTVSHYSFHILVWLKLSIQSSQGLKFCHSFILVIVTIMMVNLYILKVNVYYFSLLK